MSLSQSVGLRSVHCSAASYALSAPNSSSRAPTPSSRVSTVLQEERTWIATRPRSASSVHSVYFRKGSGAPAVVPVEQAPTPTPQLRRASLAWTVHLERLLITTTRRAPGVLKVVTVLSLGLLDAKPAPRALPTTGQVPLAKKIALSVQMALVHRAYSFQQLHNEICSTLPMLCIHLTTRVLDGTGTQVLHTASSVLWGRTVKMAVATSVMPACRVLRRGSISLTPSQVSGSRHATQTCHAAATWTAQGLRHAELTVSCSPVKRAALMASVRPWPSVCRWKGVRTVVSRTAPLVITRSVVRPATIAFTGSKGGANRALQT